MKLNLKWSLLVGVVAAALIIYFMQSDPYRDQAEVFLRQNETVQRSVGTVSKINLRRARVYGGDATEKAFREYEFFVSGQRGRAVVLVRLHATDEASKQEFFIHDVEAL